MKLSLVVLLVAACGATSSPSASPPQPPVRVAVSIVPFASWKGDAPVIDVRALLVDAMQGRDGIEVTGGPFELLPTLTPAGADDEAASVAAAACAKARELGVDAVVYGFVKGETVTYKKCARPAISKSGGCDRYSDDIESVESTITTHVYFVPTRTCELAKDAVVGKGESVQPVKAADAAWGEVRSWARKRLAKQISGTVVAQ